MVRYISWSKSKGRRPYQKKYDKKELDKKNTKELLSLAKKNIGVGPIIGRHSLKKNDLVKALLARQRGIRQVKTCPDRNYKCKRTEPLETPVLTDKGGCRYCKLHPKRKVGKPKGKTACTKYKIYKEHLKVGGKKIKCKPLRNPPTRDDKTKRCRFCEKQRVRKPQKKKWPTSMMIHGEEPLGNWDAVSKEFNF